LIIANGGHLFKANLLSKVWEENSQISVTKILRANNCFIHKRLWTTALDPTTNASFGFNTLLKGSKSEKE